MSAEILDGKATASAIRGEIASEVAAWISGGGAKPTLAAILVGDDAASQVYVRNKERACLQAGMDSRLTRLPASTSTEVSVGAARYTQCRPEHPWNISPVTLTVRRRHPACSRCGTPVQRRRRIRARERWSARSRQTQVLTLHTARSHAVAQPLPAPGCR